MARYEHIFDPSILQGLLGKVDAAPSKTPDNRTLLRQRAELLRKLGELDAAGELYDSLAGAGGDYFHRRPRRFTGGDLLLFDQNDAGLIDGNLGFTWIAPCDGSLILFAPDRLHAVTPVQSSSTDICDARWTVNGWYHRG